MRDRIRELRRVSAGDLRPHPKNFQRHGEQQRSAMAGLLRELGYADALIGRDLEDGAIQILDGHLRAEITPDEELPVLIVDLDDREADLFLATHDPLVRMAEPDPRLHLDLLESLQTTSEHSREFLGLLLDMQRAGIAGEQTGPPRLVALEVKRPPAMTWALIGLPTVRFGEIAQRIEDLAAIDGIILETTANDGPQDGQR